MSGIYAIKCKRIWWVFRDEMEQIRFMKKGKASHPNVSSPLGVVVATKPGRSS